ncbi:hypothetical protein GYMLUDRAFT_46518 [Collybiopsis luxurians FD-317 M1]|uniref:Uncharacterized protein n=1 Tax=Collybiopsis luxurians FD-317 M1 TaxID=944289 RepID=A0A0D0CPJ6_9AGAR|nr:hypothetical protein GYMLUDRAFT_46518 [Collybiopsis luxurians FD-317 M1]
MAQEHSTESTPKISSSISSPIPLRPTSTADSKPPATPATNKSKGKRKVDEVEGNTPPDVRKQRATFAADPRPHRGSSTSSHAPSSYTRKRARLSTAASTSAAGLAASMAAVGEIDATGSRPPSRSESYRNQNAGNTGTWNSSRSRTANLLRTQSRTSHKSQNPSNTRNASAAPSVRAPSRRGSISQASIPISALISPHAPSISHQHSSIFHMRDPRKPPKVQPTPWTLSFPQAGYGEHGYLAGRVSTMLESGFFAGRPKAVEEPKEEHLGWYEGGGSPPHAWLFFIGFIIFPLWWYAALLKIPKTRSIEGGHDGQKSVVLDDPQVEHDAKSWRNRCRVMSAVSLVTYIPFIVLVAIFARR